MSSHAERSHASLAARTIRPGGPEILLGILAFAIVGFGGGALLVRSGLDQVIVGLMLAATSGIAGLAGFAVAALARVRSWSAFGVRAVSWRWLVIGAGGGLMTVVLGTLLLGILTPIGEELLFRGVVTTALLRHGPIIGVVGSALIFALLHGINMIFPAAVVASLVAGELLRRSGSVWPAVIVHAVFNLPTIPVLVLAQAA